MPFKWSTVAIGSSLSIFSLGSFLNHNILPASASPASGTTNRMHLNLEGGKLGLMKVPAGSNSVPLQSTAVESFSPVTLESGVYRTQPFACIVVVPEEHLDERIAVFVPEGTLQIPMLKPDLHFIPIERK